MSINRRHFLIGVGGVVAAGVGAERVAVRARRRQVLAWAADTAEAASTRNLGVEYLTRFPDEADRSVLLGHLAGLVSLSALMGDDLQAVAGFNDRLRRDFAEGDVIRMGGWLLSRTELRLCALVATEEDARTGSTGVFAPEVQGDGAALYWTAPTARFALPPGLTAIEFQVRSNPREPQRLAVRLDDEIVDERAVEGVEWQRVRYVVRPGSESPALTLTTTPEWKPSNDFRTIGVGLDRVW